MQTDPTGKLSQPVPRRVPWTMAAGFTVAFVGMVATSWVSVVALGLVTAINTGIGLGVIVWFLVGVVASHYFAASAGPSNLTVADGSIEIGSVRIDLRQPFEAWVAANGFRKSLHVVLVQGRSRIALRCVGAEREAVLQHYPAAIMADLPERGDEIFLPTPLYESRRALVERLLDQLQLYQANNGAHGSDPLARGVRRGSYLVSWLAGCFVIHVSAAVLTLLGCANWYPRIANIVIGMFLVIALVLLVSLKLNRTGIPLFVVAMGLSAVGIFFTVDVLTWRYEPAWTHDEMAAGQPYWVDRAYRIKGGQPRPDVAVGWLKESYRGDDFWSGAAPVLGKTWQKGAPIGLWALCDKKVAADGATDEQRAAQFKRECAADWQGSVVFPAPYSYLDDYEKAVQTAAKAYGLGAPDDPVMVFFIPATDVAADRYWQLSLLGLGGANALWILSVFGLWLAARFSAKKLAVPPPAPAS